MLLEVEVNVINVADVVCFELFYPAVFGKCALNLRLHFPVCRTRTMWCRCVVLVSRVLCLITIRQRQRLNVTRVSLCLASHADVARDALTRTKTTIAVRTVANTVFI